MTESPMIICNEHPLPLFHRGPTCPWCDFIKRTREMLAAEYKRGFEDGVKAVEAEEAAQSPAQAETEKL